MSLGQLVQIVGRGHPYSGDDGVGLIVARILGEVFAQNSHVEVVEVVEAEPVPMSSS